MVHHALGTSVSWMRRIECIFTIYVCSQYTHTDDTRNSPMTLPEEAKLNYTRRLACVRSWHGEQRGCGTYGADCLWLHIIYYIRYTYANIVWNTSMYGHIWWDCGCRSCRTCTASTCGFVKYLYLKLFLFFACGRSNFCLPVQIFITFPCRYILNAFWSAHSFGDATPHTNTGCNVVQAMAFSSLFMVLWYWIKYANQCLMQQSDRTHPLTSFCFDWS